MCSIINLYGQGSSEIEGIYLVTPIEVRQAANGADYQRLWLSDSTGRLLANSWLDRTNSPLITSPAVARTRLKLIAMPRGLIGKLIDAEILDLPVVAANDWRSPDPRALRQRADALVATLTTEPLKHFTAKAGTLTWIQDAFAFGKGSRSHHHAYTLGMLEHCVETAEIVAGAKEHGADIRDLCVVGALFHDVGKLFTVTDEPMGQQLAELVGHERLTAEMLAEPLRDLDTSWPEAAVALRYVWSGRYRKNARLSRASLVAELIRTADRASAKLNRAASSPSVIVLPPERP